LRIDTDTEMQTIPADDAAGGMHEIDVADIAFRIERSLYDQRADVLAMSEQRSSVIAFETELQFCLPAAVDVLWRCGHDLSETLTLTLSRNRERELYQCRSFRVFTPSPRSGRGLG
jgi:hypothetical protein